ncbi:MAG: hypothetical protein ACT4PI_15510 [Actinomycetota bacterium]
MPPLRSVVFFRRARRSRHAVAVALIAAAIVGAACQGTKAPPIGPPPPPETYCAPAAPTNANEYYAAFEALRAANAGYFVASDGGIPIPLPAGRILWFFGDTVLGRWTPGSPVNPYLGLANNSFVYQYGNCFKPMIEAIPDLPGGDWIWPTGAVEQGGVLRVFGQHMRPAPGPFPFEFVEAVVLTYSLPGLTKQGPTYVLPVPKSPNYGETVFSDGTYVYAYGRIRQPGCCADHHFVARAPLGSFLSGGWEFWKDDDILMAGDPSEMWSAIAADRDPMAFESDDLDMFLSEGEGPLAGFPVTPHGGGAFYGSALHFDLFPGDLEIWHSAGSIAANKPAGPWDVDDQLAVNVPDYTAGGSGRYAYGGRVVLSLPGVVSPIALWSVNHESFDAVLNAPDLYKVIFATPDPASLTPP